MRRIIISDIHGCKMELKQLLEEVGARAEEVIFLGDYVDTGTDSAGVLRTVMAWVENGAAALLGNHDELFLEWLAGHEDIFYYGRIGGLATINSFLAKMGLNSVGYTELLDDNGKEREIRRRIIESFQGEISFLKERPLFMESREMIFVHAGIDPKRGLHKSYRQELLNIRDEFIYHYDGERTVVFGHTRTRKIHGSDEVYFGENRIIGIDGGCAFGGQLNALIIEDGGYDTAAVKKSTDITGRSR